MEKIKSKVKPQKDEKINKKQDDSLLVEIQNLIWGYPDSPSMIFNDFSAKIYKNDFYFILWKSGVWKTTLLNFLTMKINPPKKMMFYKKDDIARLTDIEIQRYRRKIGVIYQDFKLIEWKTVKQNIAYPLEIIWEPKEKIDKKVNEILYKMELMSKKDIEVPRLSWWEKQRVAIARALVFDPEFILADEPTGNLDQETSRKIADILISLNKSWNTILFVTHDLSLLEYVKSKHEVKVITMEK